MWSGQRLTRKQLTSRPDHLWPELWEKMGKNAKLKERQKWSHEKPQLDNARQLQGIYFIDPEDKEFKETNNARNWKRQWLPLCLARQAGTVSMEWLVVNPRDQIKTCVYFGKWIQKTAYGRIFTESSWRPHCRKGRQFTATWKSGTQNLFLCLKPWKFPQQRQQSMRNGKN